MSPRVLHLPAPGATAHELGGKGANLQRLLELGAAVPPAVVLAAEAYREHMAAPPLRDAMAAALDAPPGAREAALEALRRAIIARSLDPALGRELAAALGALGGGLLAVRSSAVGEDGASHSFAGQHDTFLGVEEGEPLELAVRRCWASAWTARAVEYRGRRGLDPREAAMAVVVQRLIAADVAGVLFTCDPVGGRVDRVVIEAVYGLGETLVSGRLAPDRVVLARPELSVMERSTAEKPFALVVGGAGAGAREEALVPERARASCLDDALARRLAEEGLRLERALGGPQDLEWALAGGELFVLQARPVTTVKAPAAAGPRFIWSNTNTGELLPDVATPMTFSTVRLYVTRLLGQLLSPLGFDLREVPLLGLIGGRIYFCMNTFLALVRSVPGMDRRNPAELFGGDQAQLGSVLAALGPDDLPAMKVSFWRMLLGAPALGLNLLRWVNVRSGPVLAAARARTEALARVDLAALSGAQLADRFDLLIEDLFRMDRGLAGIMIGLGCANGLVAVCRRWLGDEDGSLANRLLSGVGGLDSAEAGLDLWRLAEAARAPGVAEEIAAGRPFAATRERLATFEAGRAFLAHWDAFLGRHGHHTRGEVDVYAPRWREEPDAVLATVRAFLPGQGGVDPVVLHQRRAAEREQLTAGCRGRLRNPLKRAIFDWLRVRAQRGFALRENVKSEAVRRIAMMREALLEAGRRLAGSGRLARADDVFFLDLDELRAELRGTPREEAIREIPGRRREHAACAALTPPSLVVGDFDPRQQVAPVAPPMEGRLRGLGVSPGVAVGRVRVVLRADPDERVRPGEILVAPFTDPGWTPYFVAAAGVVVDMGGMLSHGSVVAREYGIPAVVNVGHGTRTLKTGQLVRVDGSRGEVTVLAGEDAAAA